MDAYFELSVGVTALGILLHLQLGTQLPRQLVHVANLLLDSAGNIGSVQGKFAIENDSGQRFPQLRP